MAVPIPQLARLPIEASLGLKFTVIKIFYRCSIIVLRRVLVVHQAKVGHG